MFSSDLLLKNVKAVNEGLSQDGEAQMYNLILFGQVGIFQDIDLDWDPKITTYIIVGFNMGELMGLVEADYLKDKDEDQTFEKWMETSSVALDVVEKYFHEKGTKIDHLNDV